MRFNAINVNFGSPCRSYKMLPLYFEKVKWCKMVLGIYSIIYHAVELIMYKIKHTSFHLISNAITNDT